MNACCKSWSNRALSLKGKVTVYNTLILSLLQCIVANSVTPLKVLVEVKKIACSFLWSGKTSRIAYSTVIQSIRDGGLRVMDLETRCKPTGSHGSRESSPPLRGALQNRSKPCWGNKTSLLSLGLKGTSLPTLPRKLCSTRKSWLPGTSFTIFPPVTKKRWREKSYVLIQGSRLASIFFFFFLLKI